MIHRIHSGHNLSRPYELDGQRFDHATYPGDRRNCQACHTSSGYLLPIPFGASPVYTPADFWSPQGPGTAACLGCHDNQDAAAHAYLNTTYFPGNDSDMPAEACGSCHGANATWSVDKVHAR
jgi:OmcA/MtrC family decaheme c-type cytochrome